MTNSLVPQSGREPALIGDELLRKPTKRELSVAVERLFLGFFDSHRPDAVKIAALYTEILSKFSAWSMKEGVRRVVEGEVEGVNRQYLPSTAIVAHTIRTVAENSPEAKERTWRNRLAIWESGRDWNSHWGQSPEDRGFEHLCPPHLLEAFSAETNRRRLFSRK